MARLEATRRTFYPVLEGMTRPELERLQGVKLRAQVERAHATNPFYRRLFDEAGVKPEQIVTAADVRRLPAITKEDILEDQLAHPPYGSFLGVDEEQIWELALSSGTSGKGREVHAWTVRDAHLRGALMAMSWAWGGVTRHDSVIFHVGATNSSTLGCMMRGIRAAGRLPYLVGHAGFEERLDLMVAHGVDAMYCMPSGLNGLSVLLEERGIDPRQQWPDLKVIQTSAESWPVEWVERMEDFWGARIFEVYGSTQTNGTYGMSNCELGAVVDGRRGAMHLYEWATLFEVVNPDTMEPVEPGGRGELVLTHLDKEASPLLRFRTRDAMRWFPYSECTCGRHVNLIESGTVGRLDDMLKVKGQNLWPPTAEVLVFSHECIDEFQARIVIDAKGRDQIELRFCTKPDAHVPDDLENVLVAELKEATDLTMLVRRVATEDVPHFDEPDKKPRRWIDDRHAGLAKG
jgi:phenylacetate-CoA ligase